MFFKRILRRAAAAALTAALIMSAAAESAYVPTAHDTKPAPEKAVFTDTDLSGYTRRYEAGPLRTRKTGSF